MRAYPRSYDLVVRVVASELADLGLNPVKTIFIFSLLGYKEVGIKWIQT